jgi:hypothetical protein
MTASNFESPYTDERNSIPGDALLYRRIYNDFIDWNSVDAEGNPRLTGQAFQDYSLQAAQRLGLPAPCMSVALGFLLEEHGFPPEKVLEDFDHTYGLAVLTAGDARSVYQGVMAKPTTDEPWHAIVFSTNSPKKNKTVRSALAEKAQWVHVPRKSQPQ